MASILILVIALLDIRVVNAKQTLMIAHRIRAKMAVVALMVLTLIPVAVLLDFRVVSVRQILMSVRRIHVRMEHLVPMA